MALLKLLFLLRRGRPDEALAMLEAYRSVVRGTAAVETALRPQPHALRHHPIPGLVNR